ncbi:MAG: M48 family metallopeptidase [Balneolaceae bacterium]
MDFFEAQDRARRNTWKLVLLYAAAVILIITSVYLVTTVIFGYTAGIPPEATFLERVWHPWLLLSVSTIIVIIILSGTLFRVAQLRRGGAAVAEMLGGRKVEPSTNDFNEQQLINVVEEMSIASGIPVPDIYVLDREENINAFAAGFGTHDAAIGVTRGTLEQLNRDELQGVIAHEFSHIFNGDMRLNIRLIGILNGILLLHIMGLILMRSSMFAGMRGGSSGKGKGSGNSAIAIIILGVSLLIIGYIGMIFGRMIQAAISRQREYLADAAAVQYTRNPVGLAGALRKIARMKDGGKIQDGHALEMSHLFFASSFNSALDRIFATHPPLEKRIQTIDPSHDPEHEKMKERVQKRVAKDRITQPETAAESPLPFASGHAALTPEVILAAIGSVDRGQLDRAGKILQDIPAGLREAAHEPFGAEALIYALLLSGSKSTEQKFPNWFREQTGEKLTGHVEKLTSQLQMQNGHREWFLPLAELALPSLRNMSADQYKEFRNNMEQLAQEDGIISYFEFALEKMVVRQLDSAFSNRKDPEVRHHHLKTLGKEFAILLSAMAHVCETDPEAAWKAGLRPVEKYLPDGIELLPEDECGLKQLGKTLDEIAASANPVKKYIITAIVYCITSDQQISIAERELLRAVSEAIDCPVPMMG